MSTRPLRLREALEIGELRHVAVGGFSSITCLPAASASRAISCRACGGVQMATASSSGSLGEKLGVVFEGERVARLQSALARDGGELEGRALGDDRQMLVLRDLAEPDDADPVLFHPPPHPSFETFAVAVGQKDINISLYRLAGRTPRCYLPRSRKCQAGRRQIVMSARPGVERGWRRLRCQGHRSRRLGPHRDHHRRDRDARPDGDPRGIRRGEAAEGRAHRRLAAHDHPDRRADRDAGGSRRRGALGLLQHLLHPGPRGIRHRRAPASRSSPTRARRWRSTGTSPTASSNGRTASTANMILDDGGDATLLRASRRARRGRSLAPRQSEERGRRSALRDHQAAHRQEPRLVRQGEGEHPRRLRGDDHRRHAPLRHAEEGRASLPGDQRQRLRHEVEVRQQVRLPRSRWSTASAAPPT